MTNNQLTDKRLAQLAKRNFCQTKGEEYTPFGDEVVSMAAELQERRKADREPVVISDDMAYEFHHAMSDSSLGADEVEEIKTGLRAAFANAAPQLAPVLPDLISRFEHHISTAGLTDDDSVTVLECKDAAPCTGEIRMTKSTITKTDIQMILDDDWLLMDDCEGLKNSDVVKMLARIALAAMDGEPYGFTDGDRRGMIYKPEHADRLNEPLPLYRHAQTVPGMLEEMTPQQASRSYGGEVRGYRDGWNDHRAAMLQAGYSPVIPDGWKLVPIDATRSMIDAARRVEEDGYDAMHKAMLAAAPQEVKP